MSILVRPIPSSKKLDLPVASTAIEFRQHELRRQSAQKRWNLEIVATSNPWLTIQLTDSRNNVNTLEVFNRHFTHVQCTCGAFVADESNFCIHAAVIDNLCKNRTKFLDRDTQEFRSFIRQLDQGLIALPQRISDMQNTRFAFYDAYTKQNSLFGNRTNPVINSVTVNANERREIRAARAAGPSLPTPSDEGLLATMTLFPYQRDIFGKMVVAKRAICSMVMGAGKTITALACYAWIRKYHKPNAKMLVICPKSLRIQWANEINREIGLDCTQVMRESDLNRNTPVFIATYQWYARNKELFLDRNFDVLVADEIQYVRNSESKTWKALSKIRSEYFYGLSGTVIENRLDDLYSIMHIVAPGTLGPRWRFNSDFQNLESISKDRIQYFGIKNVEQLHHKLRNSVFSYNRLSLPNIEYVTLQTSLSHDELEIHDEYMEKAKMIVARANGSPTAAQKMIIQGLLVKARQACNALELVNKEYNNTPSDKIVKFLELVNRICVRQNEKLVVFSEWTEMLALCKRFLPRGIGYVSYTGAQSAEKRAANLARFQNDPNCKIFFSSDAGGIGLDGLQLVSHNVVHLELPWNPSRLDQRTGRVWRTRQTKPVNCYYIVSNGGIEQHIQGILDNKRNIRDLAIGGIV